MALIWPLMILLAMSSVSPLVHGYTVRGAISSDRVYVSGVVLNERLLASNARPDGGGETLMLRRNMKFDGHDAKLYFPTYTGNTNYPASLHRWQVNRGQYHCAQLSNGNGGPVFRGGYLMSASLRMIELYNGPGQGALADKPFHNTTGAMSFIHLANSGPKSDPIESPLLRTKSFDPQKQSRIFFDFLPSADDRYEMFVTEPELGNRLTRWDTLSPDEHKGPVGPDGEYQTPWRRTSYWTFNWTGGFYVACSGLERYFVTVSGNVFQAPRGSKDGAPLVEVWNKSPVRAIIHDTDGAGKWYAFTKDEYFEITDPIKPRPHTLAPLRGRTALEALDATVRCGRLIRGIPEPKGK